ncbi:MAG: hypothetical protein IT331_01420 [Anaerolineae bacterium]|nr:hypothetical protein [Anaerolineae bacterium]
MRSSRPLCLVLFLALVSLIACANVAPPREQSALPAAPQYAPTNTPSPTPSPAPIPPTDVPDKVNVEFARPTVRPRPPNPTPVPRNTPVHDLAALNEYHRGIAYVAVNRDEYRSEKSRQALDELFGTGANYISLLVTWYQLDRLSTRIYRADNTPSDEDLAYVIDYAHAHGVKVLLKPQVNFSHDDAHWRGEIKFETEPEWEAWFDSYRAFIMHYARFAQTHGVEEFSVGTELVGATTRTADWRALIGGVRQEYTGLLTYSANHSGEETRVQFWDDLDFIGVNVFYHLTNYRTPNERQIREGWALPVRQLTKLHQLFPNQPIIFTEVGYPSMDLASVWPWNWQRDGAIDTEEQAMLYEGLFDMWWYHPERKWFRGMFIWNWLPDPDQGGPDNLDYTPHGKPAEEVLKRYYQMPTPMHTASGN